MSRFGRDDAFQFAIATGLDYTKESRAPLLKAPPGGGWELVHIQFVTDWYTVWRRPKMGHAATMERHELEESGYEPVPPALPQMDQQPIYDKGLHGSDPVERLCKACSAPLGNETGEWACTHCGRVALMSDLMGE